MVRGGSSPLGRTGKAPRGGAFCWSETVCASVRWSPPQHRRRPGWAHDSACAWTAAWLTLRGRTYLGPREILDDPEWSAELAWLDRHSFKRSWHRPDLVGYLADTAIAIEVELAPKSRRRLDAILQRHLGWIVPGRRTPSSTSAATRTDGGASRRPANGSGFIVRTDASESNYSTQSRSRPSPATSRGEPITRRRHELRRAPRQRTASNALPPVRLSRDTRSRSGGRTARGSTAACREAQRRPPHGAEGTDRARDQPSQWKAGWGPYLGRRVLADIETTTSHTRARPAAGSSAR